LTGYALDASVKKNCNPHYHSTLTLRYLTCDISTSLTPIRVGADSATLAALPWIGVPRFSVQCTAVNINVYIHHY